MPLEVINPGFGRTGTHSLKLALERLGFGPAHHMFEVRDHPEQLAAWEAVARGETVDWEEVFRGYRSQTDFPGARVWRELVARYPGAKVILTVRDPDDWFESVAGTIAKLVAMRGVHPDPGVNRLLEMAYALVVEPVFGGRIDDRETATRALREHVAAVRATVPPERLLVYAVRDGWAPLCGFLGVAVPDEPFPWSNRTRAFTGEAWHID